MGIYIRSLLFSESVLFLNVLDETENFYFWTWVIKKQCKTDLLLESRPYKERHSLCNSS